MRISVLGDDSECLRRPVWRVRRGVVACAGACLAATLPHACGLWRASVRSRLDTTHAGYVLRSPAPARTLWSRFAVISAVVGDADGLAGDSLITP